MRFHDFNSVFEDKLADSTHATHDKSQWKTMQERRLSNELRTLRNAASDAPTEFHEFVNYLRKKDANIQVINTPSHTPTAPTSTSATNSFLPIGPSRPTKPTPPEPTVSQGGLAMDMDSVSQHGLLNDCLT
ncbi:hypothetical protein K3495_g1942 [Podosphaera aphanis]|nr:hypothetical protein K3495_g1942 [Podosphaera aphanis]